MRSVNYALRWFTGSSTKFPSRCSSEATPLITDYLDQTTLYTPIVILLVLGLSFVLLTVAFRSLVIPAKAIAMNLLSVGAAFGLLVLFFQRGVGPEIFKDIAGWLDR